MWQNTVSLLLQNPVSYFFFCNMETANDRMSLGSYGTIKLTNASNTFRFMHGYMFTGGNGGRRHQTDPRGDDSGQDTIKGWVVLWKNILVSEFSNTRTDITSKSFKKLSRFVSLIIHFCCKLLELSTLNEFQFIWLFIIISVFYFPSFSASWFYTPHSHLYPSCRTPV